ncbi:DUF3363 domain-containing protein, partial [Roseovarius indicus]|uniref:DUF3363 domain-containing protein n=1 Tax=Roseovarius indicus TaxID=540747 RepID=UPI004057DFC0
LSDQGFGAEVREALEARAEHLVTEGLGERRDGRVVFARRLLGTLRDRELQAVGAQLSGQTGLPFNKADPGDYVSGLYRQRLVLASGRFAMIEGFGADGALGFQLVPWSPSLEKHLGRDVTGVARGDSGVDWDFGRKRGLGL